MAAAGRSLERTAYGGRMCVELSAGGGVRKFYLHLKDVELVKRGKRWSQVAEARGLDPWSANQCGPELNQHKTYLLNRCIRCQRSLPRKREVHGCL